MSRREIKPGIPTIQNVSSFLFPSNLNRYFIFLFSFSFFLGLTWLKRNLCTCIRLQLRVWSNAEAVIARLAIVFNVLKPISNVGK